MTAETQTTYLEDYQPNFFNVAKAFLHFDLWEEHTIVKAILHISRNTSVQMPTAALQLHGEQLELINVAINGHLLTSTDYTLSDRLLTIDSVPDQFILETTVKIKPHENTQLMGLYKSRHNYCTQCEAEGFRRITYYFDRPDVMSTFTTTITANKEKYPYLLSNGNLLESRNLNDGRHWVCWEDPSLKPCYLFALVAGDFDLLADTFVTKSARSVALQLYVEKGFVDEADYAMAALKRAMTWDEERWGREYDLDIYMIVAVSDFNMGAMENKGLNIFNTKYVLAKPDTATDQDYLNIEAVIGHEYFHNWSGNRVTCRDWFQLTLKEGLTVFRDQEFTADMTSPAVTRLDTVNIVRNQQFLEDSGPLAHPIRPDAYMEINNFYTLTVYRKGAEVIRMVETLITPEKFRAGMDLYFHRYDGQAVTTEEFLACMEAVSGQDLTQFRRWYTQAGTPLLTITDRYDAEKKVYELTVKQTCPATPEQDKKEPFYLPFSVGVHDELKTLVISKPTETFTFEAVVKKPIPSLLRNFSAPVNLKYAYTDEDLAYLFAHDTDAFARWNAGQQLGARLLLGLSEDVAASRAMELPTLFSNAFSSLLETTHEDANFLSRLLVLPSEAYLHQQLPDVDVHPIFKARRFCMRALARQLSTQWLEMYEHLNNPADVYLYNEEQVGRRSLKNTCLHYLVETGEQTHIDRAFAQFKQANNMTDRLAALSALNHTECPEREKALAIFYEQWQDSPLVVNKWLAMEAASSVPNTFDRVLELMTHEAFDIANPNNVYALLGGFGMNPSHFHEDSGKGYELIADQVIALNSKNPQVAARLIQPLTQWKHFKQPYGKLMRAQLVRISQVKNLSSDIYEVVCKSLS